MDIISSGRRVHVKDYRRTFHMVSDAGSGWSFPCDADGNLEPLTTAEGRAAWVYCIGNPDKVVDDGVVEYAWSYWEDAVGRCECGQKVELSRGADEIGCSKCGRVYNVLGQELAGHTGPWAGMNEDGEYYSEEDAY